MLTNENDHSNDSEQGHELILPSDIYKKKNIDQQCRQHEQQQQKNVGSASVTYVVGFVEVVPGMRCCGLIGPGKALASLHKTHHLSVTMTKVVRQRSLGKQVSVLVFDQLQQRVDEPGTRRIKKKGGDSGKMK